MSNKEGKHQVQYKKTPEKKRYFADIAVPAREEVSGADKMLLDIENFQQEEVKKTLPGTPVNIICVSCRGRVGYIVPNECRLPLRGDMINRHRGCEHWQMPLAMHGPIDFICPHAADPEFGDQHLFINIIEGKHDEADTLLCEDCTPYSVVEVPEIQFCLCGCGEKVRGGDKEYTGLECWKRHMMQLHGEEFTVEDEQPPNKICSCGCGGTVKGKNKFADALNCYRRVQAKARQVEIEDG